MKLNIETWKGFAIHRIFKLENGKANQGMLEEGNECFYVGAKKDNNGVMIHCAKDKSLIQKGNCIIFICNGEGSVGYANYMNVDFIGTTDIVAGYNKNLNEYNGLFIATILCQERPKFSFGRKWKRYLKNTIINLPIKYNLDGTPSIDKTFEYSDEGYVPNWQFMEDYIKSLHHKPLTTKNKIKNSLELNVNEWKEFEIGAMFDIHPTKDYKGMSNDELDDGGATPFVINSSENNAVGGLSTLSPTESGNIITFSDTTDGNTFFYQPEKFIGFAHVQGMYPINHKWTEAQMLFLSSVLMFHNKGLFSYGRKMRRDIISRTKIKLPIQYNLDGSPFIDETRKYSAEGYVPDWQFMENYIKSLPYGDRLEDIR